MGSNTPPVGRSFIMTGLIVIAFFIGATWKEEKTDSSISAISKENTKEEALPMKDSDIVRISPRGREELERIRLELIRINKERIKAAQIVIDACEKDCPEKLKMPQEGE